MQRNNICELEKYRESYENYKYIIVGCGLSGSVIAVQISSNKNEKVLIVKKRTYRCELL